MLPLPFILFGIYDKYFNKAGKDNDPDISSVMVLIDNYDDQKIQPRQDYEEDDVFPGASVM